MNFDISAREALNACSGSETETAVRSSNNRAKYYCHEGHAMTHHIAEHRISSARLDIGAQSLARYDTLGENVVVVGRSLDALTRLSIVCQIDRKVVNEWGRLLCAARMIMPCSPNYPLPIPHHYTSMIVFDVVEIIIARNE